MSVWSYCAQIFKRNKALTFKITEFFILALLVVHLFNCDLYGANSKKNKDNKAKAIVHY